MCNPLYVANNIINRAKSEYIPLTSMKLQKILYFVYRDYLQLQENHIPLFAERFATWKYGPVLVSVYSAFKKYASKPIDDYYIENDTIFMSNEEINPLLKRVLDDVWSKSKYYNGVVLSKITHSQGSAWYEAYQKDKIFLDDEDIIKDKIEIKWI